MKEPQMQNGIKIYKILTGFSLGAFLSAGKVNQYTECYVLISLGFWRLVIGRFWR